MADITVGSDAAPSAKRRFLLSGLFLLVLLGLAATAFWYWTDLRWYEETDNAYVQGNQVQIVPRVSGTVTSIAVDDGMQVERGQLLVQLDPADAQVARAQAKADLAQTVRQVRGLYRSADSAKAELNAREAALRRARADWQRRKALAEGGAISSEELAHANEALASAQAAVTSAREGLSQSLALVDDTAVATHPQVLAAAARFRQAFLQEQRSAIVSPVAGFVARRSVQIGQLVQPGQVLMAVIPPQQMWVEANFKETQLRQMRLGQPVHLYADLYGSEVTYQGQVDSLGLGTGAAFSLLPAQNASGNWIKIVQRLPVRIRLNPEQLAEHPLRIGLSMHVKVDLHDQSGKILAEHKAPAELFATDVYDGQLQQADALITQIIKDNLSSTRRD